MKSLAPARDAVAWVGLAAGPAAAVLVYLVLPDRYAHATGGEMLELGHAGRATLAIMAWMALWWLTEAIDISATALLPIVLLPITGAAGIGEATAPYANKLIFLFFGGFLLAISMQRWGLDRRIALIALRLVGTRPANMIAGVMGATALLSMFVSNTATAAMMLPIALSVTALAGEPDADGPFAPVRPARSGKTSNNFALCMMLGIAYAASIGGIATKIGTPPNGFVLQFVETQYGQSIGFVEWLAVGLPLVAVFLPLTWVLLTRVIYPVSREPIAGAGAMLGRQLAGLGPAKPGEWVTFVVFTLTALAWVLRPLIERVVPGIDDTVIAMAGGGILFVIPVSWRGRTFALDWENARRLPWGVLILFGGGLSLAAAVESNGVAQFIGHTTARIAGGEAVPSIVLVIAVTVVVIFLTELTSNTATTATLVPILAALAPGLGVDPYLLIFPAAIAASCAFMMPVATPPNAIVFGSGQVTIVQMCRAGLWLNLIGVGLVVGLTYAIIVPLLVR